MIDLIAIERLLRKACAPVHPVLDQVPGGEVFADIPVSCLIGVVESLAQAYGPTHLSAITALREGQEFQVIYHLWLGGGLSLRVRCPEESPNLPSLSDILPVADWYEREIHDMWGLAFRGHPHLRPLLLPEDWDELPPMLQEECD